MEDLKQSQLAANGDAVGGEQAIAVRKTGVRRLRKQPFKRSSRRGQAERRTRKLSAVQLLDQNVQRETPLHPR